MENYEEIVEIKGKLRRLEYAVLQLSEIVERGEWNGVHSEIHRTLFPDQYAPPSSANPDTV